MLETYKNLIARQYEAALCMLNACVTRCVTRCPAENWHAPVVEIKFCQAAFHVLFFTDIYLSADLESTYAQPFHQQHEATFADYEEVGGGLQQATYEKPFIGEYLMHCRQKALDVVSTETELSLAQRAGFEWLTFQRSELYVYNIRHIHHHAAQLSLRLRQETGDGIPWVGSGWKEC